MSASPIPARFVWLSTDTKLMVCKSIAQAVALGKPGDLIHKFAENAHTLPASKPSHVIVASRTGKKRALPLT